MTDGTSAPKKMGRPRKYPSDERRPTLTFRARDGLYEKLKSSAESGQRSISEEIEKRLEDSYALPEIEKYLEWERDNYSATAQLKRLEGMCGGRENFEFSWFVGAELVSIRKKLGIDAHMAVNELSENDRRLMMQELVARLPNRFGVFDAN